VTVSIVPTLPGERRIERDGQAWGRAVYVAGNGQYKPLPEGRPDHRGQHVWEIFDNEGVLQGRVINLGQITSLVGG
jgi:hypothetical protein